jgi:hypothetical protein
MSPTPQGRCQCAQTQAGAVRRSCSRSARRALRPASHVLTARESDAAAPLNPHACRRTDNGDNDRERHRHNRDIERTGEESPRKSDFRRIELAGRTTWRIFLGGLQNGKFHRLVQECSRKRRTLGASHRTGFCFRDPVLSQRYSCRMRATELSKIHDTSAASCAR